MIYLNNAATTWPKPDDVYRAADESLRNPNVQSRAASGNGGTHGLMDEYRREIASFFGISDPARLVLLPGCTYALNLAIHGLAWESGDTAVMSGLEHHAVSRPLRKVSRERNVHLEIMPYRPEEPFDLVAFENTLRSRRVRLVACTLASNVTGDVLPVEQIIDLAHRHGALCLVDAAQAAGIVPIDVASLGPDMLAFAGHKALYGPPGIGGLYVAPHVELAPMVEGGTGGDSGRHEPSTKPPSAFEVGTHNLPAVAALAAGLRWIRQKGIERIWERERALTAHLLERVKVLREATLIGNADPGRRTSAVSLHFGGRRPREVADLLAERHGVVTRAGFHCAPLAHETIGTLDRGGTLRVSAGYFNTMEDVDAAIDGIAAILRG